MSAEMDSRTSTFERTLFPRGCQANIACLRAGGLRHSQHIFGDLAALVPRNGSARPARSNRCPALKAMREYEEQRMHMHCGNVLNSA
jgi:hypothetical protein